VETKTGFGVFQIIGDENFVHKSQTVADWLGACRIDPTIVPVPARVDQSFDRPETLVCLHVDGRDLFCFSEFCGDDVSLSAMTYHAVVPFWVLGAGIHPDN
jgi:hypothetical protein